jgi:hypothetical protein
MKAVPKTTAHNPKGGDQPWQFGLLGWAGDIARGGGGGWLSLLLYLLYFIRERTFWDSNDNRVYTIYIYMYVYSAYRIALLLLLVYGGGGGKERR